MPNRILPTRSNVQALHSQGLLDREIAERCGVTRSAIARIRYRIGLPANRRCKHWTRELVERIGNRILNGERRKTIAAELGVSVGSLNDALYRFIGGKDYDTFHNPTDRFSRAWTMIVAGRTNAEIAAEIGVHRDHVRYYRRNMPDWWATETNGIDGGRNHAA
jgi:hypothetical protein